MTADLVLCQLHYVVPEESNHGTFVGRLAQDLGIHIGDIHSRRLRIVSKDGTDYFQVNLQNGILFVNRIIDREQLCPEISICTVQLDIIVDKPVQIHHVDVEIEDMNDNYPVFSASEFKLSISEVMLLGSHLPLEGANDPDIGTNSVTKYELSASEYFALDIQTYTHESKSVQLVLKKALDRELIPFHNLTMTAYDGGKPRLSGTVQLLIAVQDVNDNAPLFSQPFYRTSLLENALNGTIVIILNATDNDQGQNGEVFYTFNEPVSQQVSSAFHIESETGIIRVAGEIDYEKRNVYEIQVAAIDKGQSAMTGHCKILVNIIDMNDNAPEIMVTSLNVPVPEDALKGSVVAVIRAYDKDSGENGKVNCHISKNLPFIITPTLREYFSLTVNQQLDRETLSEYDIEITATDEGSPPLSVTKSLKIQVNDVNDNPPTFLTLSELVSIKENNPPGSHIYTVSAFDPDKSQNSFITYSIVDSTIDGIPISSYISINPENGKLFALLSFDHEQVAQFHCQIKATDAGLPPLSSSLMLYIFIEDINDNAPYVITPLPNLESEIIEVIPRSVKAGYVVTKIKATDADSGYNAWISYEFRDFGRNVPFAIGKHTGDVILMRQLLESDDEKHRLSVVLKDHGDPEMSMTVTIVLILVDTGQNLPSEKKKEKRKDFEILDENLYLILSICLISGVFLVTLITYTILRWNKYTQEIDELRQNTMCPSIAGSWTYQRQYKVNLNGVPPKNDLILFTPNLPQSLLGYANSNNGSLASEVSAMVSKKQDIDRSLPSLSSTSEQKGRQTKKHQTPLLCKLINLPHSLKSFKSVIVDKPLQMYRVDVEIEDINDNSPVFSSSVTNLTISEMKYPGSRFPLVVAADPDLGTNSIINYELIASDYFTLDFQKYINHIKSLELVLKKSLDREKQSVHNLTLTAYDGGKPRLSGTTRIIVNVEDFNDNAPVFDQPFYQCSVNENAAEGTLVFKLNATDLDEGRNGEILYRFNNMVSGETKEAFSLDKYTGQIRVKGKLDYEVVKMYEIQVEAIDHGGDVQHIGHCKVLVNVVDVNDNPPEMMVTSLYAPVPENSPQGTTVAIISIRDKDSGSNGKVHCYISEPSPFKVNPAFMSDFSLTVNGPLDREVKDEYEVTIMARDEGSPSLSTSKTLKVDISDANDNSPRFTQSVDTIYIKENNPPGSHIYTASASDPDIGQNSFISYSIREHTIDGIPVSSYISINPENGKVFALVSFDHEQIAYFQCHIKATDAGLQALSSNLTLNIFIEDINDNAPTFTPLHSALTIKTSRSAEPGHLITKVKAVDLNSGYNVWMFYKLKDLGGSGKFPFIIAHETGEITLKR
ncbi:homophilic cell adhesion via plasma membrane adhesion molecules [Pristimantis euphronides]